MTEEEMNQVLELVPDVRKLRALFSEELNGKAVCLPEIPG